MFNALLPPPTTLPQTCFPALVLSQQEFRGVTFEAAAYYSQLDPALPNNNARDTESYGQDAEPAKSLYWAARPVAIPGMTDFSSRGPVSAHFYFTPWKDMEGLLFDKLRHSIYDGSAHGVQPADRAQDKARESLSLMKEFAFTELMDGLTTALGLVMADPKANAILADRIWDVLHNMNNHLDPMDRMVFDITGDTELQISNMEGVVALFSEFRDELISQFPLSSIKDDITYLKG